MAVLGKPDPLKGALVKLDDLPAGEVRNRNVVITKDTIGRMDGDFKFIDCELLFDDVNDHSLRVTLRAMIVSRRRLP